LVIEVGKTMRKNRWHEGVHVLTPAFLVNSAQHACRYETDDGRVLAPGYYLALGPHGAIPSTYRRDVRYFGPFACPIATRLLQTSATALGIVEKPVPLRQTSMASIGQACQACNAAAP
jgi:hypothetical protein